jgi:hypothetical protein
MRGRADLFVGSWAEKNMRNDNFIGVHLDLSRGGFSLVSASMRSRIPSTRACNSLRKWTDMERLPKEDEFA